jgi:hypothetical protein
MIDRPQVPPPVCISALFYHRKALKYTCSRIDKPALVRLSSKRKLPFSARFSHTSWHMNAKFSASYMHIAACWFRVLFSGMQLDHALQLSA